MKASRDFLHADISTDISTLPVPLQIHHWNEQKLGKVLPNSVPLPPLMPSEKRDSSVINMEHIYPESPSSNVWPSILDALLRDQPVTVPAGSHIPPGRSRTMTTSSHDLSVINLALGLDVHGNTKMSLNNPNSNNMYSSFLDNAAGQNNNLPGGVPRLAPSPVVQQQQGHQINSSNGGGMNGLNMGMPMNAGQQMDVNMLYQKVLELSEVLRENREKTQGLVAGAEELAVSALVFPKHLFEIHQKCILAIIISTRPPRNKPLTLCLGSCRCQWN